ASWSNFLGMFQIFPSTQTEQNLGHFNSYWQAFGLVGTAIIISVILNLKNRLLLVPGITVPLGITMGMATVFVVIESTVPDNISGLATAYTSVVGTLILIVVNLPLSIWKFRKNKPRIEGNAQ
ncbi:hypothetical protein QP952_06300, partial [Corynebacterium pseudodiphtheriticum]|uniref:hypothetical protein n=1 Tax=Corynebacterium pseudodiphtheriticum TaxID=37637 RepID=UPI002550BDF6